MNLKLTKVYLKQEIPISNFLQRQWVLEVEVDPVEQPEAVTEASLEVEVAVVEAVEAVEVCLIMETFQVRKGLVPMAPTKHMARVGTLYEAEQFATRSNFRVFKEKCETYADSLHGVDFCTAKEKSEIHMFIDRAVGRLKKEDRELPQIIKIREMLSRGIAVHHGGLLPIVKECIEILFAKTLVKVLFATETFAMGLNLPTRTVVFSSTRKHDGRAFRNLLPGEFTQMSGRAGRRGLDATGTVIVMAYNEALSPTDFKEVALGTPTKLQSQFRLTYNMILNLLRIEALKVEEMIKHSFSENSTQVLLPENKRDMMLSQIR